MTKKKQGLTIVVDEENWNAIGDPASFRHQLLYKYLELKGGINHKVKPGTYDFNFCRIGFLLGTRLRRTK